MELQPIPRRKNGIHVLNFRGKSTYGKNAPTTLPESRIIQEISSPTHQPGITSSTSHDEESTILLPRCEVQKLANSNQINIPFKKGSLMSVEECEETSLLQVNILNSILEQQAGYSENSCSDLQVSQSVSSRSSISDFSVFSNASDIPHTENLNSSKLNEFFTKVKRTPSLFEKESTRSKKSVSRFASFSGESSSKNNSLTLPTTNYKTKYNAHAFLNITPPCHSKSEEDFVAHQEGVSRQGTLPDSETHEEFPVIRQKTELKLHKSFSFFSKKKRTKPKRQASVPVILVDDQPLPKEAGSEIDNTTPEISPTQNRRKDSLMEKFKLSPNITRRISLPKIRKKKQSGLPPRHHESQVDLVDTNQDAEDRFKDVAKANLKSLYTALKIPFPRSWLGKEECIKIQDIFVEPELTFNRRLMSLESLLIYKRNRVRKNPLIVIKGMPGAGKSALCQYITYSWSINKSTISNLLDIELLFLVECKFVSSNLITSLREEYLGDSISCLPQPVTDEQLLTVINRSKTLIILDGYDEGRESSRKLLRIIRRRLPDCQVIITTRLSGIKDIESTLNMNLNYDSVEFLLNYFNDEKMFELISNISNIFVRSDAERVQLLNHIDGSYNDLGIVLNHPLHLILYLMIWINNSDFESISKIKTSCDIYDATLQLMSRQLAESNSFGEGSSNQTNKVQQFLREVGRVCLRCIQAREFFFSPREYEAIKFFAKNHGIDHEVAFPMIMQTDGLLPSRDLKVLYHTTVMEHLSATFMDFTITNNRFGIYEILTRENDLLERETTCCYFSFLVKRKFTDDTKTNERNYQLDSTIFHLAKISSKQGHNTFEMGYELATYFSLNTNRNLVTLSNIISFLENRDDSLRLGLYKGLSNQSLPDPIHNWNLKHIVNLIRGGALHPSVPVKFSVEDSKNWGGLVNELVNLGCRPQIDVVLEETRQMQALLEALESIDEPHVPQMVLHFRFMDVGVNELVSLWPYPKTMHIASVRGRYPIEAYLACVAVTSIMNNEQKRVKNIKFTGRQSSYVYGLLKKALPGVTIKLQPAETDETHFEIFMNKVLEK